MALRTVPISMNAKDAIEDLCNAYARLVTATSAEARADAYAALCQRKLELASYISGLERSNRVPFRTTYVVEIP